MGENDFASGPVEPYDTSGGDKTVDTEILSQDPDDPAVDEEGVPTRCKLLDE